MKKTITRNIKDQGIHIIDDKYITKADYEKIVARIGEFVKIKTINDAKIANEEIQDLLNETMILLKQLKDAIPETGSGTAYHTAFKLLVSIRKFEDEFEGFTRNKFFQKSQTEKLAASIKPF